MQINLSTTPITNLFRAPKKLLPYVAAGLLTVSAFAGCDSFEKNREKTPKQDLPADKKGDTLTSQEPSISNDTTYFNEDGKKIREYDQDSCHVKCVYDSIGNPIKVEKIRTNKIIDDTKWYKSVTNYRSNGESTEIQTFYPKVNGRPVHPDSLKIRHEVIDMHWKRGPLTRPRPIWWNPRREILEQYYRTNYQHKQN